MRSFLLCFNPKKQRLIIAILLMIVVTACATGDRGRNKKIGATLSDIDTTFDPTSLPTDVPQLDQGISLDDIEARYQEALDAALDPGTRRTILVRLADILMLRSENEMLASDQSGQFFDDAINRYRELIQLQREAIEAGDDSPETNEQIDQMLYQLSKAYALDGRVEVSNEELAQLSDEYSDSIYTPEAKFRRAEQAFRSGEYESAQALYAEVADEGAFTPYFQNAIYMNGWSLFKRAYYEEGIAEFTRVLDNLYGATPPLKTVASSQQSLVDDTLRVMSLSFSYLDGEKTLSSVFGQDKTRPYIHKLYFALGALYFEKERYRDSANAYRQYVLDNPLSDFSPQFSSAVIDVYEKGNFPSLLIPAKQDYVLSYGIDSEFWQSKSPDVRQSLKPNLRVYLKELGDFDYANGQQNKALLASSDRSKNQEKPQDPMPFYQKAASWYEQYLRTFPNDEQAGDVLFLMAEALNEAGQLQKAYDAYARLAYNFPVTPAQKEKAAEAGYAVILLGQQIASQAQSAESQNKWQQQLIKDSLAFADNYPNDSRAVAVLADASQKLLQAERQPEAIVVAKRVTSWQPPANQSLQLSAWLVIAQSEFDLLSYRNAEKAYEQVLLLLPANDPQRASIVERRAASIYRLAENLKKEEQSSAAIQQFLRIQQVAPDTPIAITAQYDAGDLLFEGSQWQQAESVYLTIRQRYPTHPLVKTIYAKLVVIYQETEQWTKAGDELTAMAAVSDDPELQRQSLLLAADLYQKSGQIPRAIVTYENYIRRYTDPFDDYVETINKLSLVQRGQKNIQQYEYWQQQLINVHNSAGARKTDRSLYLAASAANYQASKRYQQYAGLRLGLPLKDSLRAKQNALKNVNSAYQRVIDYGVAEFVTEANFYLAEAYVNLSEALLNSQRPKGLSALALEQYDILLEEQVYPFEEKAIELHLANAQRSRNNLYDTWVKRSYDSLASLSPGRYNKREQQEVSRVLY